MAGAVLRDRIRLLAVVLLLPLASCSPGDPLYPFYGLPLPFNFHEIEPGQAYRSAQPTGEQLAAVIETHGIRTVVNLRGENEGELWYDDEASVCQAMGVTLANHAISANSLPYAERMVDITDTLLTADYPILIHCESGADRTGAISAIYRMLVLGHDKADALAELSPVFFHLRQFTPCMDTLAEWYEPDPDWLAEYAANVDQTPCIP